MEYDSVFPSGRLHASWEKASQRNKMRNAFLELRQVDHKELASLKGVYLVLQLVLLWFQIRTDKVKSLDLRACVGHTLSP